MALTCVNFIQIFFQYKQSANETLGVENLYKMEVFCSCMAYQLP